MLRLVYQAVAVATHLAYRTSCSDCECNEAVKVRAGCSRSAVRRPFEAVEALERQTEVVAAAVWPECSTWAVVEGAFVAQVLVALGRAELTSLAAEVVVSVARRRQRNALSSRSAVAMVQPSVPATEAVAVAACSIEQAASASLASVRLVVAIETAC